MWPERLSLPETCVDAAPIPAGNQNTTGGAIYPFGYAYNRLDGLTSTTYPSGRTLTAASAWSRTFGYDAYGNMWVSAASGIPAANFTPQSSMWFGANNQLANGSLNIDYDDGGSLTQIVR